MSPLDELAALLRPAGGGLFLSTGRAVQLVMQRLALYGVADEAGVDAAFRRNLAAIVDARVVILGCPSDVGAGFLRGANVGPQAIRSALLASDGDWTARAAAAGVVDIGDVFVIPQLLHDDMLSSAAQLAASRRALYGRPARRDSRVPARLAAVDRRASARPRLSAQPACVPVVLGGDHSNAWPVAANLARHRRDRWAIVQPDAHTDLLPERLGIKICFATWSYHANELLGRDGRLVTGRRAGLAALQPRPLRSRALGVRQFWADEVKADPAGDDPGDRRPPQGARRRLGLLLQRHRRHRLDLGRRRRHPEPDGLEPDFVVDLIRALGREIGLCAADVVEVAPPLARDGGKQTVDARRPLPARESRRHRRPRTRPRRLVPRSGHFEQPSLVLRHAGRVARRSHIAACSSSRLASLSSPAPRTTRNDPIAAPFSADILPVRGDKPPPSTPHMSYGTASCGARPAKQRRLPLGTAVALSLHECGLSRRGPAAARRSASWRRCC